MSGLILPARCTKQPQYAANIDRVNPITRGIVLHGSVGGQLKDSAAGSLWANSGGAIVESCVAGKAWRFNGSSNGLIRNDDLLGVTNRQFSIGLVFVPIGTTIDTAIFAIGSSVTTTQYFVIAVSDVAASTARLFFRNDAAASMEISVPNSFAVGRAAVVLAVIDGNSATLYTSAGTATGTSPSGPITLDRTGLGCNYRNGSTGGFTNCQIPAWFAWNRPLSEREARSVIANPWQIDKAPTRRLWIGASAATSYTLTAAQGSYTLTGQAATLKAARLLTAAQGSYTLTGQAAILKAARLIAAGQGSYTLSGQAAILKAARLIAAGQGSYTLTGQAAILKAARLIAAAQGSYTLNGRDASLIYSGSGDKTISAGQGSYALTGQAATLKATRKLAAAQGSYSLNGQSAALSYSGAVASYTLTAGQGSFTLTGFDALFTVIVPVFETTPRFSNTRRVGAARLGYATDTLSTPRLGHKIDAVPTRRLGARTK